MRPRKFPEVAVAGWTPARVATLPFLELRHGHNCISIQYLAQPHRQKRQTSVRRFGTGYTLGWGAHTPPLRFRSPRAGRTAGSPITTDIPGRLPRSARAENRAPGCRIRERPRTRPPEQALHTRGSRGDVGVGSWRDARRTRGAESGSAEDLHSAGPRYGARASRASCRNARRKPETPAHLLSSTQAPFQSGGGGSFRK